MAEQWVAAWSAGHVRQAPLDGDDSQEPSQQLEACQAEKHSSSQDGCLSWMEA